MLKHNFKNKSVLCLLRKEVVNWTLMIQIEDKKRLKINFKIYLH